MNDAGRDKLIEAAMNGTRQIKGQFHDGKGGHCALGVLFGEGWAEKVDLTELVKKYEISATDHKLCELCPHTEARRGWTYAELARIAHYNDFHDLDFLSIARKI